MDLHKLFTDVFHPEPDETVAVIADVPHGELRDHQAWQERREMAAEWRAAWVSLGERIGFDVLPLIAFPATGVHNGNLPLDKGEPIPLRDGLSQATMVNALTQFSATAPLSAWARSHDDFRAASLPEVARRMEKTALSADYSEVARRCHILDEKAGFHWAYGRSEHLGGTIAPEHFKSPAHIVHQDIVYAKDSPIQVASLLLISADGKIREIIRDGAYLV